jgi:hypothetical protein
VRHAVPNMGAAYDAFRNSVIETFGETTLQLWFPSEDTEEHPYIENAGLISGTTIAPPIRLPASLDALGPHIVRLHEERRKVKGLSCFALGGTILGLGASRHNRTPVIPTYWPQALDAPPAE